MGLELGCHPGWWMSKRSGNCPWLLNEAAQVSLGRAAELAGVPVGQMINILADYGVKANLEKEDYRQGLENLRRVW